MRRLLACLVLMACVPATEETDPAGAAGFSLDVSPATRGETFETADGYRLTVDLFVVNATVSAETIATVADSYHGNSDATLLVPARCDPFFTTALPEGNAKLDFMYSQMYLDEDYQSYLLVQPDAARHRARFEQRPDIGYAPSYLEENGSIVTYDAPYGPAMLVVFHAERDGFRWDGDLTLEGSYAGELTPPPVVAVKRNALVTAPLHVAAEALFRRSSLSVDPQDPDAPDDDGLRFAPFAEADAAGNADGHVDPEEVQNHRDAVGRPLGDELLLRTMGIFSVP